MATTHVYFVRISAAAIGTTLAKIAIGTAIGVAVKCFIAGTLVLTAAGLKKIEDIEVGDLVLAYDEETGETAYKPVVRLFRNESKDWTGVTVNGTEIVSTPGHKYYLPETKTWVSAEDLKVGTKVLLSDGSYGIIKVVKSIHYDEAQTTYNFEVADYHTYYVGNGVLVHNRSKCSGKYRVKKEAMEPHTDGRPGKSQFLSGVDADEAVLKAADYADAYNLWEGVDLSQAKVYVKNGPVGTIGETGELTSWIKVTRKKNGAIHGWPCHPKL